MNKLLIATTNKHKIKEIAAIFNAAGLEGWELIGLDAFPDYQPPEENGQTFAENAILHALRSGKTMDFTIQAALIHYGKNDAICMEITDTGRGYPEEVLQAFRKDDAFINGRLGVGIKNVCRRLQLVYGNQARMILSNDTALGGARATVIIPYTKIQRNEGRG